jgi:uncharacterized membrane protein
MASRRAGSRLDPVKPLSLASLSPDAPVWLLALVTGALALHIAAGSLAIVSGYGAMLAAKGGSLHRRAGLVFLAAMLLMGAMGSLLAIRIHERNNVGAGLLAAYLVASAWMTVRRPPGRVGRFEGAAFGAVLAVGATFLFWGFEAQDSPAHRLDGYPPGAFFGVAALCAFFGWGDARLLRKGGLVGTARIARHAGRMGSALFIAAGSLFIGQQKVMPASWHGSPVLLVLGLAPLALTLFWLVRIRLPERRRAVPAAA